MDQETQLYPQWRQAVEKFLASGFTAGDIVTHEWLYAAMEIEKPRPDTPFAKAERLQLQFLNQFKLFQGALLKNHQIDLTSERGKGYLILAPKDQTKVAFEDGLAEIKKDLRRMVNRLANVDYAQLTAEQRKENADHLAKVAAMSGMIRSSRRLIHIETEGTGRPHSED